MLGFLQKFILSVLIFFTVSTRLWCQPSFQFTKQFNNQFNKFSKSEFLSHRDSINTTPEDTNFTLPKRGSDPTIPFAIGIAGFFYLLNPIILFENDKIALGITKEISIGFGYFGQDRISFEYSYIFRESQSSHFRLGYKHDFLKADILPSNFLQTTAALTLGASAFTDLDGWGVSPEAAYGFSFRNDKLLIYPHIKGRFTYTFDKPRSNIIDFSFGVMVGFANPFTDLKIRRYW